MQKLKFAMGKTTSRNKNLNYNIKIQYTSFIKLTKNPTFKYIEQTMQI